jgi:cytochrome c-type biogenesis protein CcmH
MSRIDELKRQITQLNELTRSGVLTKDASREARARLQAELGKLGVEAPTGGAETNAAEQKVKAPLGMILGIAGFVLVFAVGGYAWLGNRAGLSPETAAASAGEAGGNPHATDAKQIDAMIDRLKERLKATPDDADGWLMLARSYSAQGRQAEALPAYRKAIELKPKEAQGYADLADALGTSNGGSLDGEPEKLIAKALTLDPANVKALALSGTVYFNRGDAATAAKQWESALHAVEPGSPMAGQLQGALDEARQRAGLPPMPAVAALAKPPQAGEPVPAASAGEGASIQGRITLSDKVKSMASPDDTVFIAARDLQPGKPPLAILRKQVKDLPLDFTLDDSMAMSPEMRLSTVKEVKVTARISKSGNAMTQPGDLQALPATVAVGAKGVKLDISEAVR